MLADLDQLRTAAMYRARFSQQRAFFIHLPIKANMSLVAFHLISSYTAMDLVHFDDQCQEMSLYSYTIHGNLEETARVPKIMQQAKKKPQTPNWEHSKLCGRDDERPSS